MVAEVIDIEPEQRKVICLHQLTTANSTLALAYLLKYDDRGKGGSRIETVKMHWK